MRGEGRARGTCAREGLTYLSSFEEAEEEAEREREAWCTVRGMRPEAKKKLLSAVCILVQEVVEDNGLTEQFKIWAKRWGEDELDACVLHHDMYCMLERHIMGITAAQYVWKPEEEDNGTAPHTLQHDGGGIGSTNLHEGYWHWGRLPTR